MKDFIICQMKIDDETFNGNIQTYSMSNIIRLVKAETKEAAIGKFVIETQSLQAMKKLDIECYDLSELKTIIITTN